MNGRRSYLDGVNAGRTRRSSSAIEDLSRTLDELESRFAKEVPNYRDAAGPDARVSRAPAPIRSERPAPAQSDNGDRSIALIATLASDLKSLREELRSQMSTGLQSEFETLRRDLEKVYAQARTGNTDAHLARELERLSDAIQMMAERHDDRAVNMLRMDMEQVRETVGKLARQDTVLTMDRRWAELEERIGRLSPSETDPAIEALSQRLDQIASAVEGLPRAHSVSSLEDKIRTLATAVDHFSRQSANREPDTFDAIEGRLDEISRAIAASANPRQLDTEPFERIEARIVTLARQLEDLAEDRPQNDIVDRLSHLSAHIDELGRRIELPEKAVSRLAEQLGLIAERIDDREGAEASERMIAGLEQRFSRFAEIMERRHEVVEKEGRAMLADLDQRFTELAQSLKAQRSALDAGLSESILELIDSRFEGMARNLAQQQPDDALVTRVEQRLDDVMARFDASAATPSVDPELIRSLEAQVAGLTAQLSMPSSVDGDLAPRLDGIEKALANSREDVIAAAQSAAQRALALISKDQESGQSATPLANDLKALAELARRSEERNVRTFDAIQDTLLRLSERMETVAAASSMPATENKRRIEDAPPLLPEIGALPDEAPARPALRSASEAAAAAARAAAEDSSGESAPGGTDDEVPAAPAERRSMLSGLGRVLSRRDRKAKVRPALDPVMDGAPALQDDAAPAVVEPSLDQPLEPGSGRPDLNAIMRRVRDEQEAVATTDATVAKSDFIAAARRAAQAAAAEADSTKRGRSPSQPGETRAKGGFFANRRKTLLMATAAVVVALSGVQLGSAFVSGKPAAERVAAAIPVEKAELAAASLAAPEADATSDESTPIDEDELLIELEDEAEERAPVRMASAPVAPRAEPAPTRMPAVAAVAPADPVAPAAAPAPVRFEPAPAEAGPAPLREAADGGDALALFEIGNRYAEGRGVTADLSTAAKWYQRAADAGFAPAQYRLGNIFEKGTGVERDIARAKTWYQLAAAQGNASAMHNLAVLFAMGADGTTDNESAARFFTQAAELGVKDSQFNLAILAARGVGMPQDLEGSYKWFALAAKSGDRDAAEKRDEIAKALRPDQLVRVRADVEAWKPAPLNESANSVTLPAEWGQDGTSTASVDMRQAVRNIQAILNKNGYDAGTADGLMGERTKAAITAFQRDNGLAPTGEVTEELVSVLLEKR